MMRRTVIMAVAIAVLLSALASAIADESVFDVGKHYIESVMDCSGKQTGIMQSSDNNEYDIMFMVSEGNKMVGINVDDQAFMYYPLDDNGYSPYPDEVLFSAYYRLISMFNEIQAELPDGKELSITLYYGDGSYTITGETIEQFYK